MSLPTVFLSHGSPMHALEAGATATGRAWTAPARARDLLRSAGLEAEIDPVRGLDHGAWTPLLYAFPRADVPVLQVSVQPALGPRHHLGLGRALAPLADEGVLIMGSGHLTHNLRELASVREIGVGPAAPYVSEFQDWVRECIEAHDHDRLADYRRLSPAGVRAHPSEEHFLPLFVALGAAGAGAQPERFIDHVEAGVLAMDAYLLHAARYRFEPLHAPA